MHYISLKFLISKCTPMSPDFAPGASSAKSRHCVGIDLYVSECGAVDPPRSTAEEAFRTDSNVKQSSAIAIRSNSQTEIKNPLDGLGIDLR